jgi:hypothetical protein
MNRHNRRKAATKFVKLELRAIPKEQLRGTVCAYEDCPARFSGDMPEGWRWVISYWDLVPTMPSWTRDEWWHRPYIDVAFCPEHARQLEGSFKGSAARELGEKPVSGSA